MRAVLLLLCACVLCGCATTPGRVTDDASLPPAEEAVRAHNERVARLDRLWARAIVTLRFTDGNGDKKWEQGDGHFQLKDATNLALSIGKVGEVLVWIGADDERFWVIDRLNKDMSTVYVGAHDTVTPEALRRAGLPVPPRQLLRLGGLTSIDPTDAKVARDDEDRTVVTIADDNGAWRYLFAPPPADDMPMRVERLDTAGGVLLNASLEQPKTVDMNDNAGMWPPRTFGRLLVTHVPTGDSISLLLDGEITDGRRTGKPNDAVFDLDVLVNAYGPIDSVVDLADPGVSEAR